MNLLRVSPLGFQDKDEKGVVAGAGSLDFFSLPDASVRSRSPLLRLQHTTTPG